MTRIYQSYQLLKKPNGVKNKDAIMMALFLNIHQLRRIEQPIYFSLKPSNIGLMQTQMNLNQPKPTRVRNSFRGFSIIPLVPELQCYTTHLQQQTSNQTHKLKL